MTKITYLFVVKVTVNDKTGVLIQKKFSIKCYAIKTDINKDKLNAYR